MLVPVPAGINRAEQADTGNVLDGAQQAAFRRYIRRGGGYAGVHAAADTEYRWDWYGRSWYTGGGHTAESYDEPRFCAHLLGGIRWAAGRG